MFQIEHFPNPGDQRKKEKKRNNFSFEWSTFHLISRIQKQFLGHEVSRITIVP